MNQATLFDAPAVSLGVTGKALPQLLPVQRDLLDRGKALYVNGVRRAIWQAACGSGKCLGYGTPILMFNGRVKAVQDVRPGDLLIGPDSNPRVVLSICSGREEMFRIVPAKGDSYAVNRSHILSVMPYGNQNAFGNQPINISVSDWLNKPAHFRFQTKGWRSGVEWAERDVLLDPYFLGLWLGDGTSGDTGITTADPEIIEYIRSLAAAFGMDVKNHASEGRCDTWVITQGRECGGRANPIYTLLKNLNVTEVRHVPISYKANSREVRLQVLAGLMDSDGSLQSGCFDFVSKSRYLAEDVAFLARSLGLAAYIKECKKTCANNGVKGIYHRVSISGDCSSIPCRIKRKQAPTRKQVKNVLLTAIHAEPIGEGDYYGFTIDGDGLFLLGDFTVTHNTWIAAEQTRLALEKGTPTILHIVHRRRLVDQMIGTLAAFGIHSSPIMEGRQRWNARVLCASRDTLLATLKAGFELPRVSLIIWDEAHVAAAGVMDWYRRECPAAYWTGYTATPVTPDGRSMAEHYQALACMAPASELIRIGRLVPVKVYNPDAIGRRRRKGEKVKPVGDPIDHWRKYADGLPTVVFAANVAESQAIAQRYIAAGIPAEHIDALTPEDQREEVFERSKSGRTKIICNCGVLIEGVDLPWLTCCQILRGCNSLVLWVQATGRVMRFVEGKPFGIVLDHSGAAHEFGMPDSDFTWTLEDGAANTKNNKPTGDRKPVTCVACGFVFTAKPACPECGRVLPKQRRKSLMDGIRPEDGILTQFTDGQRSSIAQDAMERLWKKLLYIGRSKGWQMRRLIPLFTKETKLAPWEAGLQSPVPSYGQWQMTAADWLEQNR